MISFAVTAFNEMSPGRLNGCRLMACIGPAEQHPQIDEIVVVDDGSNDFPQLASVLCGHPKVRLFQNVPNRGVFGNKIEAVARCRGEWVITCDSDNVMSPAFLDRVIREATDWHTWYCPSFARPNFDYRHLVGLYTANNIGPMLDKPLAACAVNTGNQTVHRQTFMEVFEQYRGNRADLMLPNWLGLPEEEREKHYWRLVFDANDSCILNMLWLQAGKTLAILEGLEYEHYYASGPEGNYTRSPIEKEKLGVILLDELRRLSRGG